jgi:hypothetical protein
LELPERLPSSVFSGHAEPLNEDVPDISVELRAGPWLGQAGDAHPG